MREGRIIDIPYDRLGTPAAQDRCKHMFASGQQCQSVRQGDKERCAFHEEWYGTPMAAKGMPLPEDAISMQRFLLRMMEMMVSGKVSAKLARPMADICKLLAANMRAFEWEVERGAMRRQRAGNEEVEEAMPQQDLG